MTQADDHRVPLNVVSVQLGKDALPSGDEGLPATYPVMLGISRPITAYELAELASTDLAGTGDPMWLVAPQTTVDAVRERLPELQDLLERAAERASAVEHAAEALAAGEQDELKRRLGVLSDINRSLANLRSGNHPKNGQ